MSELASEAHGPSRLRGCANDEPVSPMRSRGMSPRAELREFGCGVTSRHARRCCRNRGGLLRKQKACGKCDALRTTDNRPYGDAARPLIASCLLLSVLETIERNESDVRVEYSEQSVSLVSDLGWLREAFPLLAPSTSKVSIDIFVRFPLASSAGRSVHTTGLPTGRHASQNSGLPTRRLGW